MTSPPKCPVCGLQAKVLDLSGAAKELDCPRCSRFSITNTADAILQGSAISDRQASNFSSWLRQNSDSTINSTNLESLLSIAPPLVGERADVLLGWIAREDESIGAEVTIETQGMGNSSARWCSLAWCISWSELEYLITFYLATEKQWVTYSSIYQYGVTVKITPKGYDHLDQLKHATSTDPIGFCAMWFAPEVQPIWTDAISLATEDAGYRPVRIDSVEHNNRIDDEIMAQIRRSRFVVADFSGQRGGVYFEAGFALGLGLPVIWTVQEEELKDVHFDNRQYNFLQWNLDDLPAFRKALANRIEATLGRGTLAKAV